MIMRDVTVILDESGRLLHFKCDRWTTTKEDRFGGTEGEARAIASTLPRKPGRRIFIATNYGWKNEVREEVTNCLVMSLVG